MVERKILNLILAENSIRIQETLDVQTTSVTLSQGILNVLKHLMGVGYKTRVLYGMCISGTGFGNRYSR